MGTVSGRGKGGLNETACKTSDKTSTNGSELCRVSGVADASHPSATLQEEPRQVSTEEIERVNELCRKLFDILPSQSVLQRIFDAHPDFVWTFDAYKILEAKLSGEKWKKNVKTPDDLAYRWGSDGDTSLFAQVCRDLPDPTPVESSAAKSFDMVIEDVP